MGHGAHKRALGRHRLSSSPLYSTSASASMADYDHAYEAADSDPSETLCCKFHKRNGLWPIGSWETEQSPLHLDL